MMRWKVKVVGDRMTLMDMTNRMRKRGSHHASLLYLLLDDVPIGGTVCFAGLMAIEIWEKEKKSEMEEGKEKWILKSLSKPGEGKGRRGGMRIVYESNEECD